MALDIDPGSGFDVTWHCSQYSTIKNKNIVSRKRAFLNELNRKTAATVQNKQHEKKTALAYITDELLHKRDHMEFVTSSTGHFRITLRNDYCFGSLKC